MLEKAKLEILELFLKKAYPNRDIGLDIIGKEVVMFNNDEVGANDFLLKGKYTYDQVMELNKLTGYSAGFGFCKELGPVAFIGVPNPKCVQDSGYFYYEVQTYGQSINDSMYYFNQYSDEESRQIGNYTVYGMGNPRILQNKAPIEKLSYLYDYRYMYRDYMNRVQYDILPMEIKLGGTYSFYDARLFATGTKSDTPVFGGENVPIQFAIVGENQPVGIIGLWKHFDNVMFRDVWGYGENEPESQPIRFLTDEEAKNIRNFKLYYFVPSHSYGKKQYITEKIDRTLSQGFDFIMEDGTDYRLQDIQKEKVKSLNKTIDKK